DHGAGRTDAQVRAADHARLFPATRHDRGVGHQTTSRGQDADAGLHAVDVIRGRLVPDQDHVLTVLRGLLRGVCGEVDVTDRHAWCGTESGTDLRERTAIQVLGAAAVTGRRASVRDRLKQDVLRRVA